MFIYQKQTNTVTTDIQHPKVRYLYYNPLDFPEKYEHTFRYNFMLYMTFITLFISVTTSYFNTDTE